jgi:hypothetical protein
MPVTAGTTTIKTPTNKHPITNPYPHHKPNRDPSPPYTSRGFSGFEGFFVKIYVFFKFLMFTL